MSRVQRLRTWWADLWEASQVELHGHYSVAHLQEFERYHATTSWCRALAVCLLTPLPCIIAVALLDLIPLEPPEWGTRRSPHVWIRNVVTVFQMALFVLEQFRQHLPELALERWLIVLIGLAASTGAVGICFNLSKAVGYPLPFNMVIGTVPWFIIITTMLFAFKRRRLRENTGLARNVGLYMLVFGCQIFLTVVYPIYNHIYSTLSSTEQTGFIVLLPIIKIVAKNWISRTLPDSDDAKPEAVVFNVEIFHSLFVSLAMGSTTSSRTVVALMAIDLVQAWLSFHDVIFLLRDLLPVADKLDRARRRTESRLSRSRHRLRGLVELANRIIEVEPFQARPGNRSRETRNGIRRWSSSFARLASATRDAMRSFRDELSRGPQSVASQFASGHQITPFPSTPAASKSSVAETPRLPEITHANGVSKPEIQGPTLTLPRVPLPSDLATLNVVERGVLVRQTQKVLFVTEFIILVEYTEVIMPMIYVAYVFTAYYLPNRAYYPILHGIESATELRPTVENVMLYALLELASLLMMVGIVWWKLRLSLAHQLAFVLERRAINIQAKMLLWMLNIMQNSITQLGADYSFQFAWLRSGGSASTSS